MKPYYDRIRFKSDSVISYGKPLTKMTLVGLYSEFVFDYFSEFNGDSKEGIRHPDN